MGRQVRDLTVLAQLQRLDVGGDGPAILRLDARSVAVHAAEAVGDRVVVVADRRVQQALLRREGSGLREAPLDDHALAVAVVVVARGAVDVVALLTTKKKVGCKLHRQFGQEAGGTHARQEAGFQPAAFTRDRAFGDGTHGAAVREERAGLEGVRTRLVEHVAPARGEYQHADGKGGEELQGLGPHRSTSEMRSGPSASRKARVWSRSNLGSRASMARKNLSRVACSKPGVLKIEW